ncbi:hypothetical protein [Dyella humicola]|uniref:hypothetical protein n=1 Tax=Dyella humicola TaxID=2992126 RepID=UPI00225BF790|nr:hypothetical protein [Dyella humicola]
MFRTTHAHINHVLMASLVALGAATAAHAQDTASQASTAASMQSVADAQGSAATPAAAQRPILKPGDRNCLQTTGSLIPAKPGTCLTSAVGRSYSQDDIYRTGQPNLGPALQMLDPSITVRGH